MKKLLIALLLVSSCAFGQGTGYTGQAIGLGTGNTLVALPGATVQVCTTSTCSSFAQLYTDATLTTTITQPIAADGGGNYNFWAFPGSYWCSITSPGFTGIVLPCGVGSTGANYLINGVRTVDGQKYTTIAQALAALPSSGAFIVRLPSGYRETFSSPYDLGNGTTQAVSLQMDQDVILTCNVSDGSYCFNVHDTSGITGIRNQALTSDRGGGSIISLAATANVTNVIQTAENPMSAITLQGFEIDNVNGGAVSNAFINLLNLNDASTIRDVSGFYFPHIGINVSATTGGSKSIGPLNLDNLYFSGVALPGARPLVIQSDGAAATNNVNVMGGYYINPGSSLAAIEINGGGGTTGALQQILISGVYTQQAAPSTAVTGIKIVDAAGVTVQTSSFQVTSGTSGHTGISINQSGSGRTHSVVVHNFRLDAAGGNIGLNNIITGTTVLNAVGTGNIPGYVYGGSAGSQIPSAFVFDSDTQVQIAGSSVTRTIASGTATMTTAAIGAGACGATVTVSATGTLTTDALEDSFNSAVGANPGVLVVQEWPTANNVNFEYCNPTAGSVTPSAATLNWKVIR